MHPTLLSALLLAGLALGGCATTKGDRPDPRDPFERVNRATFAFNEAVDRAVARPVARAYRRALPQPVQTGVSNFFDNLQQPAVMINDLLQGKPRAAVNDFGRLLLNTTLGLGGLLDPASAAGLDRNDEDFGQTLGKWGVGPGPYLMVPLFGPYTLRDGIGTVADEFADPLLYVEDDGARYGLYALRALDRRVRLLELEPALDRAFDRYAVIRSAYLQRRAYLVSDGELPDEEPLEEDFEDEPEADPAPQD